jgi:hypothetical protein
MSSTRAVSRCLVLTALAVLVLAAMHADSDNGVPLTEQLRTVAGDFGLKHVIYEGLSRVTADAVLSGGETIRGGNSVFSVWHPELVRLRARLGKPRYPIQIVATLRGLDFEEGFLFNVPDIPVLVLTVAEGARRMREGFAARPWVRPLVMSRREDLPAAFSGIQISQDRWGECPVRRLPNPQQATRQHEMPVGIGEPRSDRGEAPQADTADQ